MTNKKPVSPKPSKNIFFVILSSLFSLPVVIFLIIATIVYITIGTRSTSSLVEQTHDRQLHLAISGAASTENFFKVTSTSLANLALALSDGTDTQAKIDAFAKTWSNTPNRGVILTDDKGLVIRFTSPDRSTDLSVADREYFTWTKSATLGDVYIGNPVIPKLGDQSEYIIPIATPIHNQGRFVGAVISAVSLNKLTTDYLNLLKFTDSTRIYLVDSDGTMLYSPFPQIQGVNYLTYLEENSFPGSEFIKNSLAQRAQSDTPDKLKTVLPDAQTKTLTSFLISHAPIIVEDQHWTLAIATPTNDAVAFVGPIYINQLGLLITTFLVLLIVIINAARKSAYNDALADFKRSKR